MTSTTAPVLKINAHAHLLPDPEDIPQFMVDEQIFWVDEKREFMHQKDWRRPVTDASFFLDAKLQWMDRAGLDHAVILPLSQLYGNGMARDTLARVMAFQNDFNASVQRRFPSRFTCGFVLNPVYPDLALAEMRRCVEELDLRILCLPTHYLDADGAWRCTFETGIEDILEMANDYDLAVEVHPYDADKMVRLANAAWRFHLVWMMAQCADAYHFYTLKGYPFRYDRLRLCFAHGAQYAQVSLGRRMQGYHGRPDLFQGMDDPARAVGHPNIFFDTLLHDVDALELTVKKQGAGQVVVGLDDPYPLGEIFDVPAGSYPGKLLDDALAAGVIDRAGWEAIWSDNTIRWLTGDDARRRQALLARMGGGD